MLRERIQLCICVNMLLDCVIFLWFSTVSSALRIAVTAPVNPVRINGVVSVHCQIWDLPPNHEVTLSRKTDSGIKSTLAWNGDLQTNIEERVFLAHRQLDDGSVVYFLTITSVMKEDEGMYNCTVLTEGYQVAADQSVRLVIQYFPADNFPSCATASSLHVVEGTEIVLNCTSEAAIPVVSIQWSQGSKGIYITDSHTSDGMVYNELRIRPNLADDKSVYICTISSKAFPLKTRTCHVGPLTVLPDPFRPPGATQPDTGHSFVTPLLDLNTIITDPLDTPPVTKINKTVELIEKCQHFCENNSQMNMVFWVVCTIIAASCACVFLIIGVALFLKTRQLPHYSYPSVNVKDGQSHQVYVELQKRQQQNRSDLYMDLSRIDMENRENRLMYVRKPSDLTYTEQPDPPPEA